MRFRLVLFGHEIKIRPSYEVKLHITDYDTEDMPEIPVWEHKFPIEKRVNVYTEFKGFIEYVFSRYDYALLDYGETALYHLESILTSFQGIREKFKSKGATTDQLKLFDEKVYMCFNRTVREAEKKAEELKRKECEDLRYHLEVINNLKKFKIENYYKPEK